MKKIKNPWAGEPTYYCYGCCPDSHHGLRMEFWEDGEEIVSRWTPREEFQGWRNTLHGGIQATLCDEIASWVIFRKFQTSGVTSKMEVRYLKPVLLSDGDITLRAKVERQMRNLVNIDVTILNSSGEEVTKASCLYFLFPQGKAREEFGFREFKLVESE